MRGKERTRLRAAAAMVVVAFVVVAFAVACNIAPSGSQVPPPPRTPERSLGPDTPPVVWLGGTIRAVEPARIRLREDDGSEASLQRLAGSATAFFRVAAGAWQRVDPSTGPGAEGPACVEALMDGTNLVAIRVFLGAGCGPI